MAEGSDNEFSAFYSSIDDEQFEAYVEIANAPTAYLVPNTTSLPRQKPTGMGELEGEGEIEREIKSFERPLSVN